MRFSDIIGAEDVKQLLRQMADSGRVPHALLLHGPSGVGKLLMARAMAQYLVCENPHNGDSCGQCPHCRQAASFNHPDIHYVYPIVKKGSPTTLCDDYAQEWHTFLTENPYPSMAAWQVALGAEKSQPSIYVAESAEIIRKLSMSTFSARYKVMIIWLPERMNQETSNKLLKIIEEPTPDTVFILVSDNPEQILQTILSRTLRVEMHRLPEGLIANSLEQDFGIDADSAASAARLSEGSMLKALESLDHEGETQEFFDLFVNVMRSAYKRDVPDLRAISEKMSAYTRDKICRMLGYFARMFRENYVYNLGSDDLNMMTSSEEGFSRNFARFVNDSNISGLCTLMDEGVRDIGRNGNARIVLFDILLQIMLLLR